MDALDLALSFFQGVDRSFVLAVRRSMAAAIFTMTPSGSGKTGRGACRS